MIKNEDTYCIVQHKIVRELGAWEAVVYGTIANLLRKTDGIGEISNQTIMDLCGMSKKSLLRYIDTLIESGYIEKRGGNGRGNISIYYITKKGVNLIPFSKEKGCQNVPKRVSKMDEKGVNFTPINKGINKEIKESGGDTREARSHTLSNTTTFFEEKEIKSKTENDMTEFDEFWRLYPGDPEWSHEKESCENFWRYMSDEWRGKLIEQLRAGLRWRIREHDNPIWYLRNYQGEDVKAELPYMRQGTAACTKWLQDAQKNGDTVCVMLIGNGDDTHCVYCLKRDRKTMENNGAKYVRDFVFNCE